VLSTVAFWPVTNGWLKARTGVNVVAVLGLTPRKPLPGRTSPAKLFWGWLALAGAHYLLCLGQRRGRALRTGTLLLVALFNGNLVLVHERSVAADQTLGKVDSGSIFEGQWPGLRRLNIVEHDPAHLAAADSRQALLRADLQTFADFHRYVRERYRAHAPFLKKAWRMEDERRLKALFFMSFVSGLWAFGNRADVDGVGCALCNEERKGPAPTRPTIRSYLESPIACCTDFAHLTKSLLDHEGIESRLTAIPGHVFNEVRVGGRWCILDATTDLVLETSWEELYAAPKANPPAVTVLWFPHPCLADAAAPQYRPMAGHFRLMMLLRLANRPALLRPTEHPDLPSYFD
jgi:hypothetical protein